MENERVLFDRTSEPKPNSIRIFDSTMDFLDLLKIPNGAKISVFASEIEVEALQAKYRTSTRWEDDTTFAIIGETEWLSRALEATQKNVNYALILPSAVQFYAERLVFVGTKPILPSVNEPCFIVSKKDEGSLFTSICSIGFAYCESVIASILSGNTPSLELLEILEKNVDGYAVGRCSPENIEKNVMQALCGIKFVVDGLNQALASIILLLTKEEKTINRTECCVLLASKLIKVYNIFVEYLPRTLFAPDNNARIEAVKEFLGCLPSTKPIVSEYYVRKTFFMLEKNREQLLQILSFADRIIEKARLQYEKKREDFGFCYGPDSEDVKFSIFLAPDVMWDNTLLDFIKDCGIADAHI